MSTAHSTLNTPPPDMPPGAAPAASTAPSMDRELVEETRRQIREIVNEVSTLARSNVDLDQFCHDYLTRVVSALAAHGGAIWLIEPDGTLRLQHEAQPPSPLGVDSAPRDPRHQLLLKQIAARNEPVLAPPRSSATGDEEVGNPSEYMLIVGVVTIDQNTRALVEVFQRAGGGPTTHRGYLRFVMQMCEHFAEYLKSHELRSYGDREALWDQVEAFTLAAHQSLDVQQTAYTIANQSRSLTDCDRVGVALRHGKRQRLAALSGVQSFDRRAGEVQSLEKLCAAVAASGMPLWYAGDDRDLPPQIDAALHAYLDQSHVRSLAIIPLVPAEQAEEKPTPGKNNARRTVGMLIGERFHEGTLDQSWKQRLGLVANHSATAITNAQSHSSIVLMPLWRTLAKQQWLCTLTGMSKLAFALVLVVGLIAAAVLMPADFRVQSTGQLQPSLRREVFAGIDGNVKEVLVRHGQQVEAGQILLRLENTDLEVQIENIRGQQATTLEEITSIQRGLLDQARLSPVEQHRMNGQLRQLAQTQIALDRELALLQQKQDRLHVRSPITGMIVTWDAQQELTQRPVTGGERLLTVVDPASRWELELEVPEKRLGHVKQARHQLQPDLHVTFSLGTHPGRTFDGRIIALRETAEPEGPRKGSVVARVQVESTDLPPLHPGATATGKIDCGERSVGYVYLHDVWETVQRQVWIWF